MHNKNRKHNNETPKDLTKSLKKLFVYLGKFKKYIW